MIASQCDVCLGQFHPSLGVEGETDSGRKVFICRECDASLLWTTIYEPEAVR